MSFSRKEAPVCDRCPFKSRCFFNQLDRNTQKEWIDLRVAKRFRDGEAIFYEGEKPTGIYVVCSGKIKLMKSSRVGQQLITRMMGPGQLFGYRSLLARETYSSMAEAMEDSVISFIPEVDFYNFLMKHPNASMSLLRQLSLDLRQGEDKARDIAYKSARARLCDLLLRIMQVNARKQSVVSGIKRKELAEMAGLTVETTVRLLSTFESKGLIKRQDKDILILDEDRARIIAGLSN
ncbi:MAG: Crp/Fnr family transcriptional regulator [Elusimicrobia bacterium]|nr:Crp/Fnr family transcriptional regulator [Elusimicrobiota bacterium]